MSDWQVGDLALCTSANWYKGDEEVLDDPVRAGGIYQVRGVGYWYEHKILWLAGIGTDSAGDAYGADAFRKINPHAPDAETIRLLNGKPVREMA